MASSASSNSIRVAAAAAVAADTTTTKPYHQQGLSSTEFNDILMRECQNELSNLPSTSKASQVWINSTNKIWQRTAETASFIICDATPNLSGNKRKKQIKASLLSAASSENEENSIQKFMKNTKTIYNGNDQTCILITSPIGLAAQSLFIASSPPAMAIKIQPLIPMTKITFGTMNTMQQRTTSKNHDYIRIKATLDQNQFHLNLAATMWKEIQLELWKDQKEHVLEAFPSSGPIVVNSHHHQQQQAEKREEEGEICNDLEGTERKLSSPRNDDDDSNMCNIYSQIIVMTLPNEDNGDYYDDVEDPTMYVDIYLHPNIEKGILQTMDIKVWHVASIVSALACRLEIVSVELDDEIVLHR